MIGSWRIITRLNKGLKKVKRHKARPYGPIQQQSGNTITAEFSGDQEKSPDPHQSGYHYKQNIRHILFIPQIFTRTPVFFLSRIDFGVTSTNSSSLM